MNKRVIILLFISLMLLTGAGQSVSAQIKYAIVPESPRPGDPVTIGTDGYVNEVVVFANGKQVAKAGCFPIKGKDGNPGFMAAIVSIPSTVNAENVIIKLNNSGGTVCEITIKLAPRKFLSETLELTPSLSKLVGESTPEKTAESEKLWEILTATGNVVYNPGKFVLPVTSTRRTSLFGTRRVNQYSDGRKTTSIHAGVDFGIPTGTEVRACGRGRVVFSRMRILTGYSVIIEHAPGVYSLYYHLNSLIAQEGSIVEAGTVIALSGSTGFATGPHLHWELRVSTENTDPDILVERALLDKDLLISKMYY
jgi:murein DD-endopeptidase MepM/ murein hydrolase activator NlpD